jgi:hypothetical protein
MIAHASELLSIMTSATMICGIVLIIPEKKRDELKRIPIFVIQYAGNPPFWICESKSSTPYGVTFRFSEAQRFMNAEDARHESMRLGLSRDWIVKSV